MDYDWGIRSLQLVSLQEQEEDYNDKISTEKISEYLKKAEECLAIITKRLPLLRLGFV